MSEAMALHNGVTLILLHSLETKPKILPGLDLSNQEKEKELIEKTDLQQDTHTITVQYCQRLLQPSAGHYELD